MEMRIRVERRSQQIGPANQHSELRLLPAASWLVEANLDVAMNFGNVDGITPASVGGGGGEERRDQCDSEDILFNFHRFSFVNDLGVRAGRHPD
jgi:hypothetical protein